MQLKSIVKIREIFGQEQVMQNFKQLNPIDDNSN